VGRLFSATSKIAVCGAAAVLGFCAPPSPVVAVAALPVAPPDPLGESKPIAQSQMTHVFDTNTISGGPFYVNDHTIVRGHDGRWHLFGIFHLEPMGDDTEVDFVHAVAAETDPARWRDSAFEVVPEPYTMALRADRAAGETHLWAPHVTFADGRWLMVYNGGGVGDDHASIRIAESDDLYRWTRVSRIPLFEDFCAARDPMIAERGGVWVLYYTRCESLSRKVSGVAYRQSRDLAHWTEPRMALTLGDASLMPNSGFTESPFVFEHGGFHYMSVTSYPLGWDATYVYRSKTPLAFPDTPFTKVRSHAAEWVASGGRLFATHAGPGQRGVWISEIDGL
jgi:hypothetical protein